MDRKLNILFLGGAKRVSLAEHLVEYGKRNGIEISIFSYELDTEVPISAVGKVILGLKWRDPKLLEHLNAVISINDIRLILPFVDPAVEVASEMKKLFPHVFIPCSDLDICRIMFDKKQSCEWFYAHQIEMPKTFSEVDFCEFPVIIKPRTGSASKGIQVFHNLEELEKVHNFSDYLVQEYIEDNTEYTVDCYVSLQNEILSVVPRIRLEVAGGEVVRSKTIRDNTLILLSEKILKTGCFRGPITIQFIKDNKTGKLFVMEINPRLGGGVVASIGAGSGMISFLIDEFLGKKPKPVTNWKEGTLMTRYFKEVIFYANNN
jgi:carbamoyl-phosphate synthase large subunit